MKRPAILLAAMVSACGGGTGVSASANVTGTVHGNPPQASSAISGASTTSTGNGTASIAAIFLSNDGALCADAAANKQPKNLEGLFLGLADLNTSTGATTVPVAAGDYQVYATAGSSSPPGSKIALVFYERTDASCQALKGQSAQGASGVVHLTGVSNGVFSGTFDITLAETDASGNATSTTDHLTGSFNPTACAALSSAFNGSGTAACY